MTNKIMRFGFLALLATGINGCVEHHHHYPKETVATSLPVAPPVALQQELSSEPRWKIPEPDPTKQAGCDVMYTTYKSCYGLGIQFDDTDMCLASGFQMAENISYKTGSKDLGTALGSVCAIACESANQNMSMPSYNDFSENTCK